MNPSTEHSYSPARLAWMKFLSNKPAVTGLAFILIAVLIAAFGGLLRPDGSPDANSQQVALAGKPPGYSVQILAVCKNERVPDQAFWQSMFFGGKVSAAKEIPLHSYQVRNDSVVGFAYGGSSDIAGRPFSYHLVDVLEQAEDGTIRRKGDMFYYEVPAGAEKSLHVDAALKRFEDAHVFTRRFALGTDKFGRDMLSRVMAGTIVSLSVGLISVLISLVLGVSLGAAAGYFGGWLDDVITWLINVVWSIPTLLLVIAITFALGKGFVQVFVAVGLTMWVEVARVVRGQVLSLRNLEYIDAARALGYSSFRIIYRHVIPNVMGPVVVISAANFASAILLEAGLSFLGIGAQIPMASWGQMIKEHYPYVTTSMAYLAVLPGLCIVALVLAFMLVGNGLRDSFDTRSTG